MSAWQKASGTQAANPYYRQSDGAGASEMWAEAFAVQVKWGSPEVARTFGPEVASQVDSWMQDFRIRDAG